VSAVSRFVRVLIRAVIDADDVGLCPLGSEGSTIAGSTLEKDRAGEARNFLEALPLLVLDPKHCFDPGRGSFFTKVRRDPFRDVRVGAENKQVVLAPIRVEQTSGR